MFCQAENLCFKTGLVSLKILGSLFWPEKNSCKNAKKEQTATIKILQKNQGKKKKQIVKYDQRKTKK